MICLKFGFFTAGTAPAIILLTKGDPLVFSKLSLRASNECASSSPSSTYRDLPLLAFFIAGLSFFVHLLSPLGIVVFHSSTAVYNFALLCFSILFHALKSAFLTSSRMAIAGKFIFAKFVNQFFFFARTASLFTARHISSVAYFALSVTLFTLIHKTVVVSPILIKIRERLFGLTRRALFHVVPNKKRPLQKIVGADEQPARGVDFVFYRLFVSRASIPYIRGDV